MKCSSRRNCNWPDGADGATRSSLNEVQFPKELQRDGGGLSVGRRTCLNEVQFPKELQQCP